VRRVQLRALPRAQAGAARGLSKPPPARWPRRTERLAGAGAMLLLQNACILVSATAAGALLWLAPQPGRGGGEGAAARGAAAPDPAEAVGPLLYWPLMAVAVAVGSFGGVGSVGAAAAVEREWVKVLCGADTLLLARVNSGARRAGGGAGTAAGTGPAGALQPLPPPARNRTPCSPSAGTHTQSCGRLTCWP
jgi:hypothetical protein